MSTLLAFCTCPDEITAERIAQALVDEHLAACVNRIPGLASTYRWKGEIHRDSECLFGEKRAAFRSMLLALEINCMLGESSVIDGVTFSRRKDLVRVDSVISRYKFTPIPIFLDCPPQVARDRIAADVASDRHLARDRTPEVVNEVLARFDTPPASALVIDANQSAAEICRIAVAAVAAIRGVYAAPRANNSP